MKNSITSILVIFVVLSFAGITSAEVPTSISYQGHLTDNSGQPVPDESYSFVFVIYDDAVGGTPLWSETQNASTVAGRFSVNLGNTVPLSALVFENSPRYLGIAVNGDPEQTPRSLLTTVPYSFQAAAAPMASGQSVSTEWVCPYFESWRSGGDIIRRTKLYFHNPNDSSPVITLTFYTLQGAQLAQCQYVLAPHSTWFWDSGNPTDCIDAAPDGSDSPGWFTISSTLPVAPWGYYIDDPALGPLVTVPLGFYVP